MDQQVKMALGVGSLVVGLLLGINVIVAEEANNNWLVWSLIFLGAAFLFWLWMRRDARNAEDAAETALQAASEEVSRLEASTQTAIGTPPAMPSAVADAQDAVAEDAASDPTPIVPPTEADVFEAASQTVEVESRVDADAVDTTVVEVETRDPEEIVEAALEGDPIAEAEIADATASAPATEADVEIPPVDVPQEALEADSEVAEAEDSADAVEATAVEEDAQTVSETEPIEAAEDDLTRVEGIGPVYRDFLLSAGIDTFAKLAELSEEEIATLVQERGGRRRRSMATWAEQAKLAAAGDWDALEALQQELSGGRR